MKWRQSGLFGNQIDAYAPVDYTSIIELHQAIAYYGGAYLGIPAPNRLSRTLARGHRGSMTELADRGRPLHCGAGYTSRADALLHVGWHR